MSSQKNLNLLAHPKYAKQLERRTKKILKILKGVTYWGFRDIWSSVVIDVQKGSTFGKR
jgi:hypothetical protein